MNNMKWHLWNYTKFYSFSPSIISERINKHIKSFESNFGSNFGGNFGFSKSSPSKYYQRVPRKTYSFHNSNHGSSTRYQPSKVSTYAHKKRQQNPYYGRRKRNAEYEIILIWMSVLPTLISSEVTIYRKL